MLTVNTLSELKISKCFIVQFRNRSGRQSGDFSSSHQNSPASPDGSQVLLGTEMQGRVLI